jgi:hypothetical protein
MSLSHDKLSAIGREVLDMFFWILIFSLKNPPTAGVVTSKSQLLNMKMNDEN